MSTRKEFVCVAEGQSMTGETEYIQIHKAGRTFFISEKSGREHTCHPSIRTIEDVPKEIILVFHVKVTRMFNP